MKNISVRKKKVRKILDGTGVVVVVLFKIDDVTLQFNDEKVF